VGLGALFGRKPAPPSAPTTAEPGDAALFPALPELGDVMAAEHARGFAEGEASAAMRFADQEARLKAEAAAERETIATLARSAQAELAAAMADSLADLLIAGLRTIFDTRPLLAAETVRSLIAETLSAAPAEGAGRLLVHPGLIEAAQPFVAEGWKIAGDPTLGWGAVRAEIDQACFAASLDRRLQRLGPLLRGDEG
jgi:flagellar biosynthesis/type III secretory pathway protein FliH